MGTTNEDLKRDATHSARFRRLCSPLHWNCKVDSSSREHLREHPYGRKIKVACGDGSFSSFACTGKPMVSLSSLSAPRSGQSACAFKKKRNCQEIVAST